jgi:hypothetical protein
MDPESIFDLSSLEMLFPHLRKCPMKVVIVSAYPDDEPISTFRERARQDRFGVHTVTDDPEAADLILFVENHQLATDPFYTKLRKHPWVRRYPEKTFMYNEHDRPFCTLPGVYAQMPKPYFDPTRQRASGFVRLHNPYIEDVARGIKDPDVLFSFSGRRTSPIRARVLELRHPDGLIWNDEQYDPYIVVNRGDMPRRYAEIMGRSRFVICPRGIGTSTFRLFETLQAGRVPVIVSDDWVQPEGPKWDTSSLRVAEADIHRIPEIVSEADARWPDLASKALAAWREWFAPEVTFHRMIESCADILSKRHHSERVAQRLPRPLPLYAKLRVRAAARRLMNAVATRQ